MVMESYYDNNTIFGDLLKVNGRYFNIQKHLICLKMVRTSLTL